MDKYLKEFWTSLAVFVVVVWLPFLHIMICSYMIDNLGEYNTAARFLELLYLVFGSIAVLVNTISLAFAFKPLKWVSMCLTAHEEN